MQRRAESAYYKMIHGQGGVNGRKIKLLSLDDAQTCANLLGNARRHANPIPKDVVQSAAFGICFSQKSEDGGSNSGTTEYHRNSCTRSAISLKNSTYAAAALSIHLDEESVQPRRWNLGQCHNPRERCS
jgi:hypothetical protein